ncbi:JAB domain-containing protein [Nitrospira sp. BLG_1]|uniref:JAB domain-containing protein n=1 Tax=Nitrospira sp. BLG_1 TaxID=3395883 RepID=UPI0039BD72CD
MSASIGRNERECGVFLNHPSGDLTPSPEDRTLTTRLREAGDLLGIRLLDHLILGEDRLYSFADQGWPP